jgi:hypothetical protein
MPADQFADWQAYFQVEPWGTHGVEVMMAQLCQAVIATSGNKPSDMVEYMPFIKHRERLLGPKALDSETLYKKVTEQMNGIGIMVVNDG